MPTTRLKCLKSWYLPLISTTFKFEVFGDSHEELKTKANALIVNFLRTENDSDLDPDEYLTTYNVNYEMTVSENQDMSSDSNYTAEVAVRIKDSRS